MAIYTVREIKEIIIETTVEADDAQKAFLDYKNKHARTSKISEETHITVNESEKELEEIKNGQE